MNGISTESLPVTALTYKARSTVSLLLKSKKVIPSDGLPRDWRGLATLANISAEVASSISDNPDCTAIVLDLWVQRKDNTATIGQLFKHLQRIDRFDVYDDLKSLENEGQLIDITPSKQTEFKEISRHDASSDFITFDDVKYNEPQRYHAYVLYAREDKSFVDELLSRMRGQRYRLCTEDDLLPGHSTAYAAVSRLISERCHRCILIYSPEFLRSPANSFYIDYVQAVGIEIRQPKMIPCMYRECQLPTNLTFYHKLHYSPPGRLAAYDFWEKLAQSLETPALTRIGAPSTPNSSPRITEYQSSVTNGSSSHQEFLALPEPNTMSLSLNELNTLEIKIPVECSSSSVSLASGEKVKKVGKLKKILNSIKGKKGKQVILVEN